MILDGHYDFHQDKIKDTKKHPDGLSRCLNTVN